MPRPMRHARRVGKNRRVGECERLYPHAAGGVLRRPGSMAREIRTVAPLRSRRAHWFPSRGDLLMHWRIRHGDILDEPADVLICSANPFLTLSGGVGGALLLRYGPSLQSELNEYLAGR